MIKTILLILVIYYSIRFLTRLFAPFLLKTVIKKAQSTRRPQEPQRQEGEVTIEKMMKKESKQKDTKLGEYVDFEELDDNK